MFTKFFNVLLDLIASLIICLVEEVVNLLSTSSYLENQHTYRVVSKSKSAVAGEKSKPEDITVDTLQMKQKGRSLMLCVG